MMTPRQIQSLLRTRPANISLLADAEILGLLKVSDVIHCGLSLEQKAIVAAEWLHRLWLRRASDAAPLIESNMLTVDQAGEFFSWVAPYRDNPLRNRRELQTGKLFSCYREQEEWIHNKIRERLCQTLMADGVIPVAGNACFVFFDLRPYSSFCGARVVDANDQPVEEWSLQVEKIPDNIVQDYQVKLHIHQDAKDMILNGASLQLPVLLAAWRKSGKLPQYRIFDLVATGCFADGKLIPVDGVKDKCDCVQCRLGCHCFLAPESGNHIVRGVKILPVGTSLDDLAKICANIIEENNLVRLTANDVISLLNRLDGEIRYGIQRQWELVFRQLDRYEKQLDPDLHPEAYFKVNMLRTTTLCHVGRADDALVMNSRMQDIAIRKNKRYEYLRMRIEALVVLTDLEQWNDISKMSVALEPEFAAVELSDEQRADLRMRYHGTMGQYHAYFALRESAAPHQNEALDHFKKAILAAQDVDDHNEMARDLNYRHLWYALFMPGSLEELELYEKAKSYIIAELNDDRQRRRNLDYLMRQRVFATYRAWLIDGKLPSREELSIMPRPSCEAEPWLRAATHKYFGALFAASGAMDDAEREFQKGLALLSETQAPVIDFIHMTIAVQAWQSLQQGPYAEFAESCRLLAGRYCSNAKPCSTIFEWQSFLLNTKTDLPQLRYQY